MPCTVGLDVFQGVFGFVAGTSFVSVRGRSLKVSVANFFILAILGGGYYWYTNKQQGGGRIKSKR